MVVYDKGQFVSRGLPLTNKQLKEYKYTDSEGYKYALRDLRKRGGADTRESRDNLFFPIYYDKGTKSLSLERQSEGDVEIFPIKSNGVEGCWRWGPSKVKENLSILEAKYVKKSDKWNISYRVYLDKVDIEDDACDEMSADDWDEDTLEPFEKTSKPKSFWWGPELSTDNAGKLLKKILGNSGGSFDNSKSPYLIRKILYMATQKNDVILDSFAGSGTTAQAVLSLNKEDGGSRKFILVECEDYADNVTAERVRRVINGVPEASDETLQEGLGGSFTFCELGDEINIESLLKGDNLPDYEALARYVFYTATGKTLDDVGNARADYFIGETDLCRVHLIYQPDRDFLRSNESALNADMVDRITESNTGGKQCLVFASAKFMGQRELTKKKIDFCQLPYAIHRVLGD